MADYLTLEDATGRLALEAAQSGHTINANGDAGLASIYQSGINGWVEN